jgi:hypothetical protein
MEQIKGNHRREIKAFKLWLEFNYPGLIDEIVGDLEKGYTLHDFCHKTDIP